MTSTNCEKVSRPRNAPHTLLAFNLDVPFVTVNSSKQNVCWIRDESVCDHDQCLELTTYTTRPWTRRDSADTPCWRPRCWARSWAFRRCSRCPPRRPCATETTRCDSVWCSRRWCHISQWCLFWMCLFWAPTRPWTCRLPTWALAIMALSVCPWLGSFF